MGEEGVREALPGELTSVLPGFTVLRLQKEMSADEFLEQCARRARGALIVAGVPGRHGKKLSRCTIEAAIAYTAEDRIAGSRVRNDSILFLMNLLGMRQIRDVVDEVDSVGYVVIVGGDPGRLAADCGASPVELPNCNVEWLQEMASVRVRRYSG